MRRAVWLEPSAGGVADGLAEALSRRGVRVLRGSQPPAASHLLLGDGPLDTARVGWLGTLRGAGVQAPAVLVAQDGPPGPGRWEALTRWEALVHAGVALVLPASGPLAPCVPLVESLLPGWDEARALDAELATLRAAYHGALPRKLEALRHALETLRSASDATLAEARAQAQKLAHVLRGGAGSYGYPELGAAAAELELALTPDADGTLPAQHPEALFAALARIHAGAERAPHAADAPLARVLVCGLAPEEPRGRALVAAQLPVELVLAPDVSAALAHVRARGLPDAALVLQEGGREALRAVGVGVVAVGSPEEGAGGLAARVRQVAVVGWGARMG